MGHKERERLKVMEQVATGAIARWIAVHGWPLTLYSDWAGHFRRRAAKGQRHPQIQAQPSLAPGDISALR